MCRWHFAQDCSTGSKNNKKKLPNPQTINNPPQPHKGSAAALHASLPAALPGSLCFNTSLSWLPSCPTLWILIPACHFFLLHSPPPLHKTLAVHPVITRAQRKPFHLKDWQLSQWNTIKWLPLERKGKFELWYAAACRAAFHLKWEQRWRSWRRWVFHPWFLWHRYLIIIEEVGETTWV